MTLIERLEKAGEGSLADLIDRLTLYEHREGYDGKDWEKIASEAAEAIRALHADKAMLTGQLQASRAMLAASPSVGGWEREVCTGCTSSLSIDDIKVMGVVSCCPDRHMVRIGALVDAYTARPPRILPQTEKGS